MEGKNEARSIGLTKNAEKLCALKGRLFSESSDTPLFDSQKFVNNLENIYSELVEKYKSQ
jgi:predicted O-linked N-acetylglucosamine transferase (SPINDLY family)